LSEPNSFCCLLTHTHMPTHKQTRAHTIEFISAGTTKTLRFFDTYVLLSACYLAIYLTRFFFTYSRTHTGFFLFVFLYSLSVKCIWRLMKLQLQMHYPPSRVFDRSIEMHSWYLHILRACRYILV